MAHSSERERDDSSGERSRIGESGAGIALTVAAIALFFVHASYLFREPVDDAGISVAYARTLAEGGGLRITAESAAAEGFSNPSWTFLLAALELLGIDTVTWLRPLGMLFAAAGIGLIALWGPASERRRMQVEDALGPLVAAAHPSFVHWAQGGLEMGVQVFAIALVGLLALGPQTARRASLLGAAAALLVLTRPEGALYAAAAGLGWVLMMGVLRRRPSGLDVRLLAWAAAPVLAYLAFRRLYFGAWLPNTYYSKHAWDFDAPRYIQGFFDSYRPLCLATLGASLLGAFGSTRLRVRTAVSVLVLAALVYFAYWAKGDWMREWRFLAVVAPLQGACIAAGLSGVRSVVARQARARSAAYAVRLELVLGVLAAGYVAYRVLPTELARSPVVKQIGWDVAITLPKGERFDPVYRHLAPLGMTHPLVVASDMGVIALGMRDAELWDFAGLTDPAISRHFAPAIIRHWAAFDDYMRNEGPPSMALAWGPANFFPSNPLVALYDEVAPRHYLLKGLTPAHDPRCPGGKAAVLATPTAALEARIVGEARAGKAVRALARWRCAHAYRTDDNLPSAAARGEIARIAERLGEQAERAKQRELALRQYSLCAVVGIKHTRLSSSCRIRAEKLRLALFGTKQ